MDTRKLQSDTTITFSTVNVTKHTILGYIQNFTEQGPGLSWTLFEQKFTDSVHQPQLF